ncbi:MAG: GntP family permease [Steroidobacteraceae bacterium]|nr:GntP family permease [Steroidobacteraceae bacterium]MCW5573372.1 GntP family permease [Steroidobacteraceae bacterium]
MLSLFGLLLGLALLIWLTMRGTELLVAAPLCALLVAAMSGFAMFPQLAAPDAPSFTVSYMRGFVDFVQSWFFMFLLGSLFGKMMECTGAADSVANWIVARLGAKHAVGAVVAACAVLTYGGVSLFVVAFSVYPMAVSLFRRADLPRRFIPSTIAFGSVTFTMTSAGSPEIQNWIPIRYLGTTPYAGWEVSLVVALFMLALGRWWLLRLVRAASATGERFEARAADPEVHDRDLPAVWRGLVPLGVVLIAAFLLHEALAESALIVALGAGVLVALALNFRYAHRVGAAVTAGSLGALVAIANTSAVVGFGGVAKLTAGFQAAVEAMTSLPGSPLIGAGIAVSVIAGLTGSASGGQTIALPLIAPHYLDQGVDPEALHRVVAISSGGLDSLPHNGYVVTTIRAICNESYAAAYPSFAALTIIVPVLGTILAVVLFSL